MSRRPLIGPYTTLREIIALVGHEPGKLGYERIATTQNRVVAQITKRVFGFPDDHPFRALRKAYDSPEFVAYCADNRNAIWRSLPTIGRAKSVPEESKPERAESVPEYDSAFRDAYESGGIYAQDEATPDDSAELAKALAAMLKGMKPKASPLDETAIRRVVAEECERIALGLPVRIEVQSVKGGEFKDMGLQHKQFESLLRKVNTRLPDGHRLNIWLSGPAGSGKTTAAKNVAKALGLEFHFNGAVDTEYKLLGFTDAQGRIVSRPFRRAYEFGGVYLFDEIDASMPAALLAFNAATANGECDFPDGCVTRHPDCVIIAAANTFGQGAGASGYVGRMKQDDAFLDRFAYLKWETDEKLERAVCGNPGWNAYVVEVRRNVAKAGIKVIVSPRASIFGAALLAAGDPLPDVIASTLRKGMSDEQWNMVKGSEGTSV